MNLESYLALAAELGVHRGRLESEFPPEPGSLTSIKEAVERDMPQGIAPWKPPLEDLSWMPGGMTSKQHQALIAGRKYYLENRKAIAERNRKNGNGNKKTTS